jgi:hypothetical protein
MAKKLEGLSNIKTNMGKYGDITWEQGEIIMRSLMAEAEGFAVLHAPWTDRTGMARNSLQSYVFADKKTILGVLAIGVFYGKYLELSNGGKYRIIRPTLRISQQYLMSRFKNIKLPSKL